MDVDVSTSVAGNKPQRIRRIQTVTLVLLFMAGIVNFLDRSSLSVAGEAIRGELGLSATEFGVLLSAFSLSYGFSQLPSGILLDRFGPRIVLGAGLIFWSLMQALTGMVNSFSHFILMRIGLGIGEAPFMPAGVKSITDWYAQKERGTALGIFNSSTVIGQAIAPPALVLMQLAWAGGQCSSSSAWRGFLSSRRRSGCGLTVLLSIGWRKKATTWRRRVKRLLSAV